MARSSDSAPRYPAVPGSLPTHLSAYARCRCASIATIGPCAEYKCSTSTGSVRSFTRIWSFTVSMSTKRPPDFTCREFAGFSSDVKVLHVGGKDRQSPCDAVVVADHHAGKPRRDRADDVPAGR